MGIYSHLGTDELTALRQRLVASLTDRLTMPTSAGHQGRNVAYQQRSEDIRREIAAVNDELAARQGTRTRAPIYVY